MRFARNVADCLFSSWSLYRRIVGGRWEQNAACCSTPISMWWRVEVFMPNALGAHGLKRYPVIVRREDYRGLSLRERLRHTTKDAQP